jgi:general secretion pathway protein C
MEMLRRHLWVIDLAGIALGAVVSGQAAASLVVSALPAPQPAAAASRPKPERDRGRPAADRIADRRVDRIVERNIFCSTCGDAPAPSSAAQGTRALTLLAVMFAPPPADGGWSVAIIRNDATATAGPYTVGARVGDATIEAIDEVRVTLDVGGGRRELLELLRVTPPTTRTQPARSVDKLGAHRYRIPRATLDEFVAGGATTPWPRVVPQSRDGQPIGFALHGIRGPFAAIGLEDGDVLLGVNGASIATPDAALDAYAKLRTASHVWLAIERNGQRTRMDYDIR